jgi:hypothetical protein
VQQIIYENSKGSAFYHNERKKDEELSAQIEEMLRKLEKKIAERRGNLRHEVTSVLGSLISDDGAELIVCRRRKSSASVKRSRSNEISTRPSS